MKSELDDDGVIILLGDKVGGEAIMLRGDRVWISTASLLYTHVVGRRHTQFRLAQNSTGIGSSRSSLLRKSGSVYGCTHVCVLCTSFNK